MLGVPKIVRGCKENKPITRNDKNMCVVFFRKQGNPRKSLTPVIHHPLII